MQMNSAYNQHNQQQTEQ